ncbi:protease complex subunit PrcB family protein [Mucisphaera sp.]|uniref:protease complex subunit PrcB family protein n=1 Tax=Mucisphaera sp. TaxID=2913024 RepID=UPI003D1161AE
MHRVTSGLILALSLTAATGCALFNKDQTTQASAAEAAIDLAKPLGILETVRGDSEEFPDPGLFVINDPADLNGYDNSPLADLAVDFNSQSIIVLALGQQPTGGYWASIDAIQREGTEVVVQGKANRPAADQMVSQVISHPFAAAVVPKIQSVTIRSDIEGLMGAPRPE